MRARVAQVRHRLAQMHQGLARSFQPGHYRSCNVLMDSKLKTQALVSSEKSEQVRLMDVSVFP